MNFLELCQDVVRKAGSISGTIASVTGQAGEAGRVVGWVGDAYEAVQNEHQDWEFLRADITFDALPGVGTYTAAAAGITGFGSWRFADEWRCHSKAAGVFDEQPLVYSPYDAFRRHYAYGANRLVSGRPTVVTQRPDESLQVWPLPDDVYTVVGEQFRAPLVMTANADTPCFATEFHRVIVWRAVMFYAENEGDATLFASAQSECGRILSKMESRHLPAWDAPRPMA